MNTRVSLLCAFFALSAVGKAEEAKPYILSFIGESWRVLGSEDFRQLQGVGWGFARVEPRFRFNGAPGELLLESFFLSTSSQGTGQFGASKIQGLGCLGMARYHMSRVYGEIGIGLEYMDQLSYDISSHISSTPTAGIGYTIPIGKGSELRLGVRLHHVSNAGLQAHNKGQNERWLLLTYQY